jgi:hypothetical protein
MEHFVDLGTPPDVAGRVEAMHRVSITYCVP